MPPAQGVSEPSERTGVSRSGLAEVNEEDAAEANAARITDANAAGATDAHLADHVDTQPQPIASNFERETDIATLAPANHPERSYRLSSLNQESFPEFALRLQMTGPAGSALHQMSLQSVVGNQLNLVMDSAQSMLLKARQQEQLTEAFSVALGEPVLLNIAEGDPGLLTASLRRLEIDTRRREQAIAQLNNDPVIQFLNQEMGAKVLPHTVVSLAPEEF